MGDNNWHWQERGTAWKGVGIYHVTLTVPSREPILGHLMIPENDPKKAYVQETPLAKQVVSCLLHLYEFYPEVLILQFCVMPDHIHAVIHIRRPMKQGIRSVIRGFWQGVKKYGRQYSLSCSSFAGGLYPPIDPNKIRDKERTLPHPIFTEMPFIRPLVHKGQLQTMIRYVQMNPQRLATKRLMPGFFRVQHDVEIAGRKYDTIGNIKILQAERFAPVHVRSVWVEDAERHGDDKRLRDYKNGCIAAARKGTVMVSPFISPHEKAVLDYLLLEHHTIIYIADNGFGEYYKPASALFDAVAEGRMLILSPWQHDPEKKHVTRAECVAMNQMAEEICNAPITT